MPLTHAAGLLLGLTADALLGDPQRRHPVAGFGGVAGAMERLTWADSRRAGALYVGLCVLPAVAVAAAVQRRTGGPARLVAVATVTWAAVGARSLRRAALGVHAALERGDLAGARELLPTLCGRDPSALEEPEIARAVVESVAENTSDAVVAPLLWGAVAGLPGLVGYRAVNTLDAMVGHRSPRYARFGTAAARLDDVANLVPSRVTAVLTVAVAPLAGADARGAWRAWRRDGSSHPSPNAGQCEAAVAGALGVRLGGTNVYAARTETRPFLGDGPEPARASTIPAATRLASAVSWGAAVLAGLVALRPARRTA